MTALRLISVPMMGMRLFNWMSPSSSSVRVLQYIYHTVWTENCAKFDRCIIMSANHSTHTVLFQVHSHMFQDGQQLLPHQLCHLQVAQEGGAGKPDG